MTIFAGSGLVDGIAGEERVLSVDLRDAFGNRIEFDSVPTNFSVHIAGPETRIVPFSFNDTIRNMTVVLTVGGLYSVRAYLDDTSFHVNGRSAKRFQIFPGKR